MESYRILSVLHILVVIGALGSTFAYPFLQAFAERTSVGGTRFALRFMQRLDRMVVYPGLVLSPLLGIGLIFDDATGYKDDMPAWLMVAIAWFIVAAILDVTMVRRSIINGLKTLDGVPDDGSFPPAYLDASKKIQMFSGIVGLSIAGIAVLMVYGTKGGF